MHSGEERVAEPDIDAEGDPPLFEESDVGWLLTIKPMMDPDNHPGWQSSSAPTFNTSDLLNAQINAVTAMSAKR
jgi:hypothetical protein